MSGATAMLPSAFAMRTSSYNDFLYAPVGEEDNGMILTALSAIARLGVDPWDEAARLSALPREAALKRLTSIIAGSSHGKWAASAVGDIAARLTALLPTGQGSGVQLPVAAQPLAAAQPLTATMPKGRQPSAIMVTFLIVFFINAAAFTVLRHYQQQPSASQTTGASSDTASNPIVPLP